MALKLVETRHFWKQNVPILTEICQNPTDTAEFL